MAQDQNKGSDKGGNKQNQTDDDVNTEGMGNRAVRHEDSDADANVGTGSGNKSGGSGKKAVEHHEKDNSG